MWTRPPGAASRARSASEPRLLPAEQQELEHYAAGFRRTRRQPGCCTRQTQCREGGPHSEIRGTAPPFALAAQHSTALAACKVEHVARSNIYVLWNSDDVNDTTWAAGTSVQVPRFSLRMGN